MIIYNVTVKIDHEVHEEWFKWMKAQHIPDVMDTGLFEQYRFFRLLGQDESEGITYAIQYFCQNLEDYQTYQEEHAPELQKEHTERYKDKFVAFRTILQEV